MTAVSLRSLSKRFPGGKTPAVDALDLDLESAEFAVLLGPSGCGKTTALRLIAGLDAPDEGDIVFDGCSVARVVPERRGAVLVFQDHMLFPTMTVAENVGFGLRMRRLPEAEIALRVETMLERVRLPGLGSRRVQELSGGQRQRVALARALAAEPRILLLDEPFSSLDANLRAELREMVREAQREAGVTTLLVTHDREEALVLADRVAVMLDGRIRQVATPRMLWERPVDVAVASFLGFRNLIPGSVRNGRFESLIGTLVLPSGFPDGFGHLLVRPEAVRVGADPGGVNAIETLVRSVRYQGGTVRLVLEARDRTLDVTTPALDPAPGDRLWIAIPPEALWVVRS